jgi:molecular chaperone DnaJ
MDKDYYKILGVEKNASEQDIRRAFLKLSKKYHPDMQSGKTDQEKSEAEEKFKEINEANEILSNKEKREYYDNFGTTGNNNGFGAGGIDPREFFRQYRNFHGFSEFHDDFGFGNFGAKTRTPPDPNSPKRGRDVQIRVNLDLDDILYGSTREFTININDPCPQCKGTGSENGELIKCTHCNGTGMIQNIQGHVIMQSTCHHCGGTGFGIKTKCTHCDNGFIHNERNISINIPQGIQDGVKLRIKGEGEKGLNGADNGDIYVVVMTANHELFERNGQDLITEVFISPITAALGGDVDAPTPWGTASLKIPKGTIDGRTFKLSQQGIKQNNSVGDLYVIVHIETIKNCTTKQEKLLKELSTLITDDNLENNKLQKQKYEKFKKKNETHFKTNIK